MSVIGAEMIATATGRISGSNNSMVGFVAVTRKRRWLRMLELHIRQPFQSGGVKECLLQW